MMELRSLSDFIEQQKNFITIEDNKEYTRVTTKLHRKGVVLRDVVKGLEVKTKKQQVCKSNQLLVAEIDAKVGGYGIVPENLEGAIVSSHYFLFDINQSELLPKYLSYLLKTDNFFAQIKAKGSTNYAAIRPKQILKIEIPYCDIEAQKNIVQKFDNISSKRAVLIKNIEKNEQHVSNLYQSILQEAISGKLIPQDPNDEPASELLKKIQLVKDKLIQEKKIKKDKPLPPITEKDIPFKLTEGWKWTRLGEICYGITSGSTPPQEHFSKKEGIPYLKVYNIINNRINFQSRPQYIDEVIHNSKNKRSILYPGDVVMNIVGPPLGKIAIIPRNFPEWNCNQAIVFFRPYIKELNSWIYIFLCEGSFLKSIELIGTAGQDNISVTKSKNILIPLPPLSEQKRISKKVKQLTKLCHELEEKLKENKKNTDSLMGSVLREGFAF